MVISDYYTGRETLDPEVILRLSEQLLQAIAFLHEVGYIHGGMPVYVIPPHVLIISPEQRSLHCILSLYLIDISSRNIAFTPSRLSKMTEECLFEVLGSPKSSELVRLDGKPLSGSLPSQLVEAVSWDDWIDDDEEDLRIIDL